MALKVSNRWTVDDLLRWEQQEEWSTIATIDFTSLKTEQDPLALIIYARSMQALHMWPESQLALAAISPRDRKLAPVLTRFHLLQARECRAQGNIKKALSHSFRALALSKKLHDRSLISESNFSLALSQAEAGQPFSALDAFDRLCKDKFLSDAKKSKAHVNRAWLLWDLGQIEALESSLDKIPKALSLRFQIQVDILAGRSVNLDYWLKTFSRLKTQSPDELVQIAMLLLEWHLIYAPSLGGLSAVTELVMKLKLATEHSEFVVQALTVFEKPTDEILCWAKIQIEDLKTLSWRDKTERGFIAILFLQRYREPHVAEIYKELIDDTLRALNLATPLMPRFAKILNPSTSFERKLSELFGSSRLDSQALPAASVGRCTLQIQRDVVLCHMTDRIQRLELKRSPVTISVLSALSGTARQEFSKEYLHRALTGSRYAPHLHDDRIYKLIQRLNQKFMPLLGQELISFRGDNVLRIHFDIKTETP